MLEVNTLERARIAQNIPTLSIIVPTFNERDNIPFLLDKIEEALEGITPGMVLFPN
jgi:hypothetical protein